MVAMLSCRRLSVAVPGRTLVTGLDFALDSGDFLAVLGQNGSGKTLTLHALAGLRAVGAGQVCLEGELLALLPRRHVAKKLALLPQSADDAFPATVQETVLIGRHPHVGSFAWESDLDRRIAAQALELVHLANFSVRDIGTLSGGERRRVAIAQVLTQQPNVYLLDEPTNHLDPQHQLEVMRIFRDKALAGATVVASLHDVNLAVRYASHCLLLYGDGRWDLGPTSSLLDEDRLSDLYATRMEAIRWRDRDIFMASEPAA